MDSWTNHAINAVAMRFREHQDQLSDWALLRGFRAVRAESVTTLFGEVEKNVRNSPAQLTCRVKRLDAVLRKIHRQSTMKLTQMDDILGFRIIVDTPEVQRDIVNTLERELPVKRVKDYLTGPRDDAYRGVHLIARDLVQLPGNENWNEYTYEIQVRTYYQHLWASTSESFGEQVKEGGGTSSQRAYLTALSKRIHERETAEPRTTQLENLICDNGPLFSTIHYDRSRKVILGEFFFGLDVQPALRHLEYLEEMHRQDAAREPVMLGVATSAKDLRVSHVRYFSGLGIPALPDALSSGLVRPD